MALRRWRIAALLVLVSLLALLGVASRCDDAEVTEALAAKTTECSR